MLTYKVQVVQIAAHIIPQPVASAIQHHTILLAIVVVGLIFAPGRFLHHFTYKFCFVIKNSYTITFIILLKICNAARSLKRA